MKYNYLDAVKEDVRNYIDENREDILDKMGCMDGENPADYTDEIAEYLNEILWTEDSVTLYTFNTLHLLT